MATTYLDRDELIRVAADIADRDGWLHLTMSSVAKQVNRHVTSLYGHVDGIDGLRREVQRLALTELGDRCWAAALGRSGADALGALLDVYREYTREHPGRSAALFDVDMQDEEVLELGRRLAEPFLVTLRSFGVDEDQLLSTQAIISVSVRGFGVAESSGRFARRVEADSAFAQMRALFIGALQSGAWPIPDSDS
jgi:AcrR family transcriptional regulator